jgi:hypothetical protein
MPTKAPCLPVTPSEYACTAGPSKKAPSLELLQTKFRPKPQCPARGRPLSSTSVCWYPSVTEEATLEDLDALIQEASDLFKTSSSWDEFVPKARDAWGDFHPNVGQVPHPAAHLLNRFRLSGAPVARSGTPWTFTQNAAALTRGPHQSARQHIPFLRQEFVDMIRKGQWTLLPVRLVLNKLQLRLSPLGVVPQRDHTPHTISDYSFFGVNHETVPLSPEECMQFGRALWQILSHIKSANPHLGPVYLSKIDIANGFYRVWVRASDVPKLGVMFPAQNGEEYLVGLPIALSMVWTESPKIFTSATEMVADIANADLAAGTVFGPHHFDAQSELKSPVPVILAKEALLSVRPAPAMDTGGPPHSCFW